MLLNRDGTERKLSAQELLICAEGLAKKATKEQQNRREQLLRPLREILEPATPYSGRIEQTAVASL